MGGFGSGRQGWRRKSEHLLALDIRRIAREGRLWPGSRFGRYWSRGGEPSGNIGITVAEGYLRLRYTCTPSGGDPFQVDERVQLTRTPCHYGGSRAWFRCPRCHTRRAVLYGIASDGCFGCRGCMRLAYASEAESRIDRINRRLQKLEAKLGASGERPKWMRWRTYERICKQYETADLAWGEAALARLGTPILPYLEPQTPAWERNDRMTNELVVRNSGEFVHEDNSL